MSRILIAYFSNSGFTAKAANDLAAVIGADVHEIRPKTPYTAKDLNWKNPLSRSMREYFSSKSRPAIIDDIENISQYDIVLIGFPIWCLKAPNIINTFFEQHDFSGKTLSVFATSHQSGISKAENSLKKDYANANWKPGILANGKSVGELKTWVERLGA